MNEHYAAVLSDLRNRKAELENQLRELESTIAGVQRLAGGYPSPLVVQPTVMREATPQVPQTFASAKARYAHISVRWGVLWHLAEYSQGFQRTADLAKALLDGGYKTDATNFVNMVSAVLSTMKQKGEVEADGVGGYQLTSMGHEAWAHIRTSPRFRTSISANAPPLLVAQ